MERLRAWCWRRLPLLGVALVAALAGYGFRGIHESTSGSLSSNQLDRNELSKAQRSLSEIENSKAELDDLAHELVINVRVALQDLRASEVASARAAVAARDRAIQVLEQAIVELEGTDLREPLTAELLPLLESAGRIDDWLNRYLEVAYRQPGHALVKRRASDALRLAAAHGRLPEVTAVLVLADTLPTRYREAGLMTSSSRLIRQGPAPSETTTVTTRAPDAPRPGDLDARSAKLL